ncbi:MAG TPA: aminotransferase class I/II-fold pyridoxal phosphate-dependent enzyme [Thermomicrobiales bacterium]|nr:aminotransferase class I/II-fold pyridoxal phosphate-dependent enzyme [Thermomicrobiales bacterium]
MSRDLYDSLSVSQLTGVLGKKWTTFPGCIGAFIAEMDYGTAPVVQDELRTAVESGFFGYVPYAKFDELAEATQSWYRDETGWEVPVSRIHAISEVLYGLELAIQRFSRPGSKVIIPTPAYMPFLSLPTYLGREVVQVPLVVHDGRWEYDYDALEAAFADNGGLLVLCNPSNPTGRVLERDELVRISEIVDRYDGRVFADEVHAPLIFPGQTHIPYASISAVTAGHTITSIAATKAWNIAGLKCAQLITSNDADEEIWKGIAPFALGPSTLGVVTSIAAYNHARPWLQDVVDYLDGNRKVLADVVAEYLPGARYIVPEGTYLAWIDLRDLGLRGDLGYFFREHAEVAVVDGRACGEVGEGFVRFNFAMPQSLVGRAIRQMGEAVARTRGTTATPAVVTT